MGARLLSCITIIFVANKRVQDVIGTVIVGLHRNSSLQCNCIKQWALHTHLDNRRLTYHYHFQYTIKTRRPASAGRTARRQFQATGQPVSRTQASDAMTSRLPCYEAKCVQRSCFQWGSVPLRSDIKGTELPLAIYWYHSKGKWLRYNFAADSCFYITNFAADFSSFIVEIVQKTTNLGNLSPFWGS